MPRRSSKNTRIRYLVKNNMNKNLFNLVYLVDDLYEFALLYVVILQLIKVSLPVKMSIIKNKTYVKFYLIRQFKILGIFDHWKYFEENKLLNKLLLFTGSTIFMIDTGIRINLVYPRWFNKLNYSNPHFVNKSGNKKIKIGFYISNKEKMHETYHDVPEWIFETLQRGPGFGS